MKRDSSARRGMVLYVVAVVVAMLSLAGLSYVTMLQTENEAVDEVEIGGDLRGVEDAAVVS